MTQWAVVLAGGVGSRFWPLSTPQRPKQLLPLVDREPMLAAAVRRLGAVADPAHTLILTNASLAGAVAELLPQVPRENVIAEPRPAGTAAALAWAASEIARRTGPESLMVCVHADSAIADERTFVETLRRAGDVARQHGSLVTVGIVPSRPDPGFGYIQPGEPVEGGASRVARFVEKPDAAKAERMVREGFLWNSGIFAWRVGDFLDEIRTHTPEVAPALDAASGDLTRFFGAVRAVSVDVGVLERTSRVLVVPGDFDWDDVGTWAALRRLRHADGLGNASVGTVHALDAHRNVVHAEGNAVVLYGVDDLVVVTQDGLTLVTTVERSVDLKALVDSLPPALRDRGA